MSKPFGKAPKFVSQTQSLRVIVLRGRGLVCGGRCIRGGRLALGGFFRRRRLILVGFLRRAAEYCHCDQKYAKNNGYVLSRRVLREVRDVAEQGTKGLICLCGYIIKAYKGICRFIKFCLIRKESIR